MYGEKTFGVRVNGVSPKRVEKYGPVINIDSYGKSKRKKEGNLNIKYERGILEKEYPDGKIPPAIEDLINIALATFCADKMVKRDIFIGSKIGKDRYFTRKIKLVVPVSDKGKWLAVQQKLEKTISFMTYDLFQFKFIKRKSEEVAIPATESEHDSVALFSGGLDSLAGSYFLTENGHKPIFVSVNHTGIHPILSNLYTTLPEGSMREIGVYTKNLGSEESTQFSRSFVYLSFAVAFALAYRNVNRIFMPENGIIALQIGLKEGRHGTRTAHPRLIMYFNDLVNSLFTNKNLSVENPFSHKTKTEIVNEIKDVTKIEKTISCAHTRFLKSRGQVPEHCGMGIPCLIRTIAFISSNLPWAEEILNVRFNPFLIDFANPEMEHNISNPRITEKRWYRDGLVNLLDIIRLAIEIKNQPPEEIAIRYPEFLDKEVYEMYKRFSQNALKTVEYFLKKNPSLKIVLSNFEK